MDTIQDKMLSRDIEEIMSMISEKMCFADIWIDRISEGKVKWLRPENEETIAYLNDKYNLAFEGINCINERYTEDCPIEIKYWAKSFLKVVNEFLNDFQIKLFNSIWSLKSGD